MTERENLGLQADPFRDWDAAYVLGALSVDDRREYELHLSGCSACNARVSELAGMPGLLAAVPASQVVMDPLRTQAEPTSILPKLVAAVGRQRRRTRVRLAGLIAGVSAAAAGASVALVLVLPGALGTPVQPPTSNSADAVITMQRVAPGPLTADVRLVSAFWGTRIDSHCSYGNEKYSGYSGAPLAYAMYVTNRSGAESEVATWLAAPGTTVEPVATTSLRAEDIAAIDIRSVATGQVLLESTLDG
jgi:hypothetical protein